MITQDFLKLRLCIPPLRKRVLPNLDRVFAAYGVPQVVKSDNGPPFNGHEFAQFADYLDFKHNRVTPM